MPPPPQTTQGGSTFDKSEFVAFVPSSYLFAASIVLTRCPVKMGAIMGTGVGLTIGLIFVSTEDS